MTLVMDVGSDLKWWQPSVVGNEAVHRDVLAVHVAVDPVTYLYRHHRRVEVMIELEGRGGEERQEGGGGGREGGGREGRRREGGKEEGGKEGRERIKEKERKGRGWEGGRGERVGSWREEEEVGKKVA